MKTYSSNCKNTKLALKFLSQLLLCFSLIENLTWFSQKFYYSSFDLSFAWLPLSTIEDKFPAQSEQRMNNKQVFTQARQENWVRTGSRRKYGFGTDYRRRNIRFSFLVLASEYSYTVVVCSSWKHPRIIFESFAISRSIKL